MSYLTLAHWIAGDASNPFIGKWAYWQAHFPPLFPLILVVTGTYANLPAAHMVVAAFAVAALALFYAYAVARLDSVAVALALAALFVLTPAAWIHIHGILSEPLFLAASLGALLFHHARLAGKGAPDREWLAFGILVALACLARMVGLALVAALFAQVVVHIAFGKEGPRARQLALAVLPALLLLAAWRIVRPADGSDQYQYLVASNLQHWIESPRLRMAVSASAIVGSWIDAFTTDPAAPLALRAVFIVTGIAALGGAIAAARANRLDGWYFLGFAAILFGWVFGEQVTRRLIYPIVPLGLLFAACSVRSLAVRLRWPADRRRIALAVGMAIPAACALPAFIQVQEKSFERTPVLPSSPYSWADISDYYETHGAQARRTAAGQVATIAGLEALARVTPPDARVMWMRPEYVALLGHREGIPWYFRWDAHELARQVRATGTTHLVLSRYVKTDLTPTPGDPAPLRGEIERFAHESLVLPDATDGSDAFVLLQVDPGRLDDYLRTAAAR